MIHKPLIRIVFIALISYSAVCFGAWFFQESLIFHPSAKISRTPAAQGIAFSDVWLKAPNNEQIHAWDIPATDNSAPWVLFFHGNGGNLGHRLHTFAVLHELGFSVLAIDYRGYGHSEGRASVRNAKEDAQAAWAYLTRTRRIAPGKIALYGRSLGGGVAADLASRQPAAALILESTFSSLSDIGEQRYPLLPVKLLLHEDLDSAAALRRIHYPTLIAHSRNDRVVPYELGERLHRALDHGGLWYELTGSHNKAFRKSGDQYYQLLAQFIRAATMPAPAPHDRTH